jgi:predicted nucleic acid-binding protein
VKEVRDILGTIRRVCRIEPLTFETHDRALDLVRRYGYSIYDSLLVASALIAGCTRLYSEDFQHGQLIERRLRIVDPFSS